MLRRYLAAGAALLCSSYLYCSQPRSQVHEWGNGVYRPRPGHPDDILNFSNFTAKRISSFSDEGTPEVKHISYGPAMTATIDKKGDLYVYRLHELNNVQLEEVDDTKRDVKLLMGGGKFVSTAFTTKGVLFALNEQGEVWQWRFDRNPESKPRRIPTLFNIVQISCGIDHFAALDKQGRVWTMGDDSFGQCGIGNNGRQVREPYFELRYPNPNIVDKLPGKVTEIVCGAQHTLAVLESGDVYGWGRNNKRQLGPTESTLGKAPLPVCFEPVPMIELTKHSISKIAAGDNFSIFVSKDGRVFASGLNTRGQLGLGYLNHTNEIVEINSLSNFVVKEGDSERPVKIKKIACGAEHCLALLDVGAIYAWGGNEFGEQGNKKRTIADRPNLLKEFRRLQIEDVFVGRNANAVISRPVPPKSA